MQYVEATSVTYMAPLALVLFHRVPCQSCDKSYRYPSTAVNTDIPEGSFQTLCFVDGSRRTGRNVRDLPSKHLDKLNSKERGQLQ